MRTPKLFQGLGNELANFFKRFAKFFKSDPSRKLAKTYVEGQLSDAPRKNAEAIALKFNVAPRTLQRLLESNKWKEDSVRDECQKIVAKEHAHVQAIGCIDESGTAKSGSETVGAARQWLGSCGKVDNGVVGVHLSYSAPGFQCLLDSQVYLPEDWTNDLERRKKTTFPRMWCFARSHRSP